MVTVRCGHGLVCLVNAGRALHPLLLDPCGTMPAMGERADQTGEGDDTVLTSHRVVRDGSVWKCVFCRRTEPFGPLTDWGETCRPRRGGDR